MTNRYMMINGKAALDPWPLYQYAQSQGLPVNWFGRANSIHVPRGVDAGTAYILVDRATYDAKVYANSANTLAWVHENGTLSFPGWYLSAAHVVTLDGDGNAAYFCELRDVRAVMALACIHGSFNVRCLDRVYTASDPWTGEEDEYYSASLYSGSFYDWQDALDILWGTMASAAGASPTLGWTPTERPEGLRYHGDNSLEAIDELLAQLGGELVFNHETATFSVVQSSVSQSITTALDATLTNRQFDFLPIQGANRANVPATIRVYFPRRDVYHGFDNDTDYEVDNRLGTPKYIDVATNATGAGNGTIVSVWDTTPAYYDQDGNLENNSELTARASVIASAKLLELTDKSTQFRRHVNGIVTTLACGSEITDLVWRDYGDSNGAVTEIHRRHKPRRVPARPWMQYEEPRDGADTMIVKTPSGGVAARSSNTMSTATAKLYKWEGTTLTLAEDKNGNDFNIVISNLAGDTVGGNKFVATDLVRRSQRIVTVDPCT